MKNICLLFLVLFLTGCAVYPMRVQEPSYYYPPSTYVHPYTRHYYHCYSDFIHGRYYRVCE